MSGAATRTPDAWDERQEDRVDLEITEDGVSIHAARGELRLAGARERVCAVLNWAAANGYQRVLVDLSSAAGLEPPSFVARIEIAHEFARTARIGTALAIVAPDHIIDEERVGVVLAGRLGLRAHIGSDRTDALAWLKDQETITIPAHSSSTANR
ncbi:hypothetical protein [Lysobacter xanthus]